MKYKYFSEPLNNGSKLRNYNTTALHAKQAHERIQEFNRLKKARQLLDAISLTNELLADASDVEILSLATIVIKRFKVLGVCNITSENSSEDTRMSMFKPPHAGIYHCCTFCSSGGKKEAICGCRGLMPGGYKGCGHGHVGHPGVHHWSCCGSILRYGCCLSSQKNIHQLLF
ncbi:hypothetical protein E2986_06511 [Frieseomelitta varia]|uniref:Tripartite motif-containing protein 45 n=1 Tax=Frieseomelitta varia TaxID=561572 RepID=A0A833W0B6_9HYME|nr:hypothetical protein E2986_06511 [Frieseomelitta varia]